MHVVSRDRGATTVCVALVVVGVGCHARDGASDGCFMRATLEQADGEVLDYDVPIVVHLESPERPGLHPVDGLDLVHSLGLSWPEGLSVGTYDFVEWDIRLAVATMSSDGDALGSRFPEGSLTFTELGPGLAGTFTVERRDSPSGTGRYVVDVTDVEFRCE